jgi:uncharacterized membrane protein YhiD involved in acid resistance
MVRRHSTRTRRTCVLDSRRYERDPAIVLTLAERQHATAPVDVSPRGDVLRILTQEEIVILMRVLAAVAVGASIGFERTFHGRPAGFRTHALVCLASSLLMLVTVYQNQWMTVMPLDAIRTDPTRMAQGIMTGIGFLGAGVIFKEGLTVRGLTTAGSIWITAAIGILLGIGFYFAATVGGAATLAVLAAFRFSSGVSRRSFMPIIR